MQNDQKKQIQIHLRDYVGRYDSQNQASFTLRGVSSATISQILNNNWNLIKDSMWRTVSSQIGYMENSWKSVDTVNYKDLYKTLSDAQEYSNVLGITGRAGTGKTFTLKEYAAKNKKTYLLCCNEYWTMTDFLRELLIKMGRDYTGLNMSEMMKDAVLTLKSQANPLIVMDEADKLHDRVLYFFITLYNELEDRCGIILIATSHLQKRIRRGVQLGKKGCEEIYSRVGGKFIELQGVNFTDVIMICQANGIDNKQLIKDIWSDSKGDLRRVKRKIHAIKMIEKEQNKKGNSNAD